MLKSPDNPRTIRRRLTIEWDDLVDETAEECVESFKNGGFTIQGLVSVAKENNLIVTAEDVQPKGETPNA